MAVGKRPFGGDAAIASLAHKVYLDACWQNSFFGMIIAWAIITKIEG